MRAHHRHRGRCGRPHPAPPDGLGPGRCRARGRRAAQLAAQLAVYLAPPGYGEMFSELGFDDLVVKRARAGATAGTGGRRPRRPLDQVSALGSAD